MVVYATLPYPGSHFIALDVSLQHHPVDRDALGAPSSFSSESPTTMQLARPATPVREGIYMFIWPIPPHWLDARAWPSSAAGSWFVR